MRPRDALSVGRTPVREAIQRLASEDDPWHVHAHPPYVAPILEHELAEIVEMRFVLEVPAARYAAMRATALEREDLEQATTAFHRAVLSGDVQAISDSDTEIHRLIVASTHNSYLMDCAQRMAGFSRLLWRLSSSSVRFDDETFRRCHDEMVAAICSGDSEGAAAAAAAHVLGFKRRLSRLVQGMSDLRPGFASE